MMPLNTIAGTNLTYRFQHAKLRSHGARGTVARIAPAPLIRKLVFSALPMAVHTLVSHVIVLLHPDRTSLPPSARTSDGRVGASGPFWSPPVDAHGGSAAHPAESGQWEAGGTALPMPRLRDAESNVSSATAGLPTWAVVATRSACDPDMEITLTQGDLSLIRAAVRHLLQIVEWDVETAARRAGVPPPVIRKLLMGHPVRVANVMKLVEAVRRHAPASRHNTPLLDPDFWHEMLLGASTSEPDTWRYRA